MSQAANNLILFYAAECGLKAVWMMRNRLRTTDQLAADLKAHGHDLVFWARQLRLPASIIEGVVRIRLRDDPKEFDLSTAHQAWRYGVKIHEEDETVLRLWLYRLCDWISQELSA